MPVRSTAAFHGPGAPKPRVLVTIPMPAEALAAIGEPFEVLNAPGAMPTAAAIADHAATIDAVLTNGAVGFPAAAMDALPRLSLVCALGAGHENIDVAHARALGIVVANGTGTNDTGVADHAMALLLAAVRAVPRFDRACRAGVWRDALPVQPGVSHKRLGVLGLGAIGRKIARRAEGFEMAVGYHARTPRGDVAWPWFDSPCALAQWCDFLVVATPGGAATRHLVDAAVLEALGPRGFLVNIARGSVVDTAALASALQRGAIAGAGLDVYESEPAPPAELLGFDHVVLTPHTAGASPEAQAATLRRFLDNATRHFRGESVVSPV